MLRRRAPPARRRNDGPAVGRVTATGGNVGARGVAVDRGEALGFGERFGRRRRWFGGRTRRRGGCRRPACARIRRWAHRRRRRRRGCVRHDRRHCDRTARRVRDRRHDRQAAAGVEYGAAAFAPCSAERNAPMPRPATTTPMPSAIVGRTSAPARRASRRRCGASSARGLGHRMASSARQPGGPLPLRE